MSASLSAAPAIFWHSDPLRPDDTAVLAGDGFAASAQVEFLRLADDPAGTPGHAPTAPETGWTAVTPLQQSSHSLKAVVSGEWEPGIFACRVRQDETISNVVFLNAPDPWWVQGDEGLAAARAGGWLRLLGKCLSGEKPGLVMLQGPGSPIELIPEEANGYSLAVRLPENLIAGRYSVQMHNGHGGPAGWRMAGEVEIQPAKTAEPPVVNVLDFGADPRGRRDSTFATVQALERLQGLGGGVLFFPAGRYRIDSILRSGMFIATPLRIPPGVTLRGAGAGLTSLWWPDRAEPLPTLLEGSGDFGVEDLGLYTQGRHRNIISSDRGHVRIRRVRIRANCYYMTMENGRPHHRRGVDEPAAKMGAAIELCGPNVEITDCDIYHSALVFFLKHVQGGLIARNRSRGGNHHVLSGGQGVIFEQNEFIGNSLTAGGSNVSLFYGASSCRHVYYARNQTSHIYGGDHEALTFDGHGTAYFGRVAAAGGETLTLAGDLCLGRGERDSLADIHDTTVYIHAGRGTGQRRQVVGVSGRSLTLDRAWQVPPDSTSVVSVGVFNGRHIFLENTMSDTGTIIQLYPPNCECLIVGNRAIHASNLNSVSKLGFNRRSRFQRVEPSWYNQFLGNQVVMGNGWGAGETEIDRWIGGETTLNLWGWQVSFEVDEHGCDQDRQLTEADLKNMLGVSPTPGRTIPLSRFQIVRRHRIDNNSSIRVRGAVADVLIEKCLIQDSEKGVRVDNEVHKEHVEDLGQLAFEPEQLESKPGDPPVFLTPSQVLIRRNEFSQVPTPCSGTALREAKIVP